MSPRHRAVPPERTALYNLPCRDCDHPVQVRLHPEAVGHVPVFCAACLTARVRRVTGARRPKRTPSPQRKTA